MKRYLPILLLIACQKPEASPESPPDLADTSGTAQKTPLAACVEEGKSLTELWSVDNGHGAIQSMSVAPSGDVALAGADGSIKLWKVHGDAPSWSDAPATAGGLYGAETETESLVIALGFDVEAGTLLAADADGLVERRSAADGASQLPLGAFEQRVNAVTGRDGEVFVATEEYQSVARIDGAGVPEALPVATETLWHVESLRLSGDRLLAAGDWYGLPGFSVWNLASGTPAFEAGWTGWAAPIGMGAQLRSIAELPDGRIAGGGGPLSADSGESFGLLAVIGEDAFSAEADVATYRSLDGNEIFNLAVTGGGDYLAAVGSDGTLRLFDAVTLEDRLSTPVAAQHLAALGDDLLVTSGDDGVLRLFGCE